MKDVIISYSDLSGSLSAVIASDALDSPKLRICNYNEFSRVLSQVLADSKKEKIGTLYIISFILRRYHLTQLEGASDRFDKVVYISHNRDKELLESNSECSWLEVIDIDNEYGRALSSAEMASVYFDSPSRWALLVHYASAWAMHDLETMGVGGGSNQKAMYIARALNDVFTDFSKQCTGVIRAGRYFQLLHSFFTNISTITQDKIDASDGSGRWFEDLAYADLHAVYVNYINFFTPTKSMHKIFEEIGAVLKREVKLSSNAQRMCLLTSAVAAATITYEGASNDEIMEIIGTRVYIPRSKVNMSVLSHLLHTYNLVDVAAVFYPGSKVELRSNRLCSDIDVGAIAMQLGGGGQRAAAGFNIKERGVELNEVRSQLTTLIARQVISASELEV